MPISRVTVPPAPMLGTERKSDQRASFSTGERLPIKQGEQTCHHPDSIIAA
jgi:hypothetical protein